MARRATIDLFLHVPVMLVIGPRRRRQARVDVVRDLVRHLLLLLLLLLLRLLPGPVAVPCPVAGAAAPAERHAARLTGVRGADGGPGAVDDVLPVPRLGGRGRLGEVARAAAARADVLLVRRGYRVLWGRRWWCQRWRRGCLLRLDVLRRGGGEVV